MNGFLKICLSMALLCLVIWPAIGSEKPTCANQLSVLYYPQYPAHLFSAAHVKLRVGDTVYTNNRKPGTFDGYVRLAERNGRASFIEFPISFDPNHVDICHTIFKRRRTCADSTAFPLQYLGLLPRNSAVHIPTGMALQLYWRSRKLGQEFKPKVFGNPRLIRSDGFMMDLFLASMPLISTLSFYAVKKIGVGPENTAMAFPFAIIGSVSFLASAGLLVNAQEIRNERHAFMEEADLLLKRE